MMSAAATVVKFFGKHDSTNPRLDLNHEFSLTPLVYHHKREQRQKIDQLSFKRVILMIKIKRMTTNLIMLTPL